MVNGEGIRVRRDVRRVARRGGHRPRPHARRSSPPTHSTHPTHRSRPSRTKSRPRRTSKSTPEKSIYRTPGSGSSAPQGCILLYGPPGCGKSYFLKSTANEFRLPHEIISCRKLKEQFAEGVKTQLYFKKLFARARQSAPSMIILDDIDEITSKKSLGHQKIRKAVFHLLRELDNIKAGDRLLITATSDQPYLIEPLLFKARRFDKLIFVPMPNSESREGLFDLFLKDLPTEDDVNLKSLGRITRGYNGADIERVIEYAIQFAEDDESKITMHHLENAVSAVTPRLSPDLLEPIKRFFLQYKSGNLLRGDAVETSYPGAEVTVDFEEPEAISAEEAGVEFDAEPEHEPEALAIDWSDADSEETREDDEEDEEKDVEEANEEDEEETEEDAEEEDEEKAEEESDEESDEEDKDKESDVDDEFKIDFDAEDDDDEDDSMYRRKWVKDDFSLK